MLHVTSLFCLVCNRYARLLLFLNCAVVLNVLSYYQFDLLNTVIMGSTLSSLSQSMLKATQGCLWILNVNVTLF